MDFSQIFNLLLEASETKGSKIEDSTLALAKQLRGVNNETILHFAVVENMQDFVEWLITSRFSVNVQNEFGETPLMNALTLGYSEMAILLIKCGADLAIIDDEGNSALHCAYLSSKRDDRTIKFLIEKGASESLKNIYGEIPSESH